MASKAVPPKSKEALAPAKPSRAAAARRKPAASKPSASRSAQPAKVVEKRGLTPTLNDRQQAFCREYVIDGIACQAAVRAGYSPISADKSATKLMKDARVRAEIDRLMAEKRARADVSADEIIQSLTNIMRADIRDVLEWGTEQRQLEQPGAKKAKARDDDEQGEEASEEPPVMIEVPFVRVKTAAELPSRVSGAIAEVSLSAQGTFKVKMHDKGAAIDKLMKHLGLYEADNKQKTDPLAELIKQAQGTALPVASRYKPGADVVGGADE